MPRTFGEEDSYDSCLFLFEELVAVGGSTHGDIVRFSFTGFVGGRGQIT